MQLIGLIIFFLGGYMAASEILLRKRAAEWADAGSYDASVDVLARTIWGEARGEGVAGMVAVASVVMNRVARPGWWGADVISVCRAPAQFSCWNRTDPNFIRLLSVDASDPVFAQAVAIAGQAVSGGLSDPTGGATHYHAQSIRPSWAAQMDRVAQIGRHIFYRGN